jgi:hypothetical protein
MGSREVGGIVSGTILALREKVPDLFHRMAPGTAWT